MLSMLIAYDAAGDVIATLDYALARDAGGNVIGLVDFEMHELAGGKLRDIWNVSGAVGSATWPEWIGARAHDFRVELDNRHKLPLRALVHKVSGYRRERMALEGAVMAVEPRNDGARDIRHLVGGPSVALVLDDQGKTVTRPAGGTPDHLPVIGT